MSGFYIILPSNSLSFPDNKINKFRVNLPQTLNFNSEWYCGVHSVIYPHSWSAIGSLLPESIEVQMRDGSTEIYFIGAMTPTSSQKLEENLNMYLKSQPPPSHPFFANRRKRQSLGSGQTLIDIQKRKKLREERLQNEAAEQQKADDEAKQKAEEEAKKKADDEAKKIKEEADKKAEEEKKKKEEADKKAQDDKKKKDEADKKAEEEKKKKEEADKKAQDDKKKKDEADKKAEEEKKKKEEADKKAQDDKKKKDEADKKAEEERKKKEEADKKAQDDKKKKDEADKKALDDKKKKEEADKKAEEERKKKEEADKKAEEERKKKEEADKKAQDDKKKKEEADKKAQDDKKKKDEADKKAEEERKKKEEADKKAEEERKKKEEADKKAQDDKKKKDEADKKAEEERKKKEEADKKAEEERKKKEEADKKAQDDKKKKEEADKKAGGVLDFAVLPPIYDKKAHEKMGEKMDVDVLPVAEGFMNVPEERKIEPNPSILEKWGTLTAKEKSEYTSQVKDLIELVYRPQDNRFELRFINRDVKQVKLSEQLAWVLGFKENIVFDTDSEAVYPPDLNGGINQFCIYSNNLTDNMMFGDVMTSLLRIVSIDSKPGEMVEKIYHNPIYNKVATRNIKDIEIEIKSMTGEMVNFNYGPVVITLHFKKGMSF